ncbi:MAG TPA: adenylate/guanylate cyclase domain-containing protein, partial [Anaerolineales bacterium]|nr:adenylate/guanylate cyclase domain-containing protein [Anaerolineales bacterium]
MIPDTKAPTPLAGERRVVTVLFADIAGFTSLAESMDPEEVLMRMNECFDILVPIIEKYGGSIDKFIGDEIMALFGAPYAHEDDPVRALRAALEMMKAQQDHNDGRGIQLSLHIGINTGLAIAGGIGSKGRQTYSVLGDAVNVAFRLKSASQPGEILVGPDTFRLTAPLFTFEALDPVQVRGRNEPVSIYRVLEARSQPESLRGLAGLKSPMVGRQAELTHLIDLTKALCSGVGAAALITGEAGLGKSRLVMEWR